MQLLGVLLQVGTVLAALLGCTLVSLQIRKVLLEIQKLRSEGVSSPSGRSLRLVVWPFAVVAFGGWALLNYHAFGVEELTPEILKLLLLDASVIVVAIVVLALSVSQHVILNGIEHTLRLVSELSRTDGG
jgi:hypothetical protein